MAPFVRAASADDIPEGSFKAVEIGGEPVLIVHHPDGFYAVSNRCSHDSAPISDGAFKGNEVICHRHGARFDVKTGAVTRPPAVVPIDTYQVKIEGNDVLVQIEE
jgi:3-phenylpropionate/trans-cinnamate dioxygenase ferredoxin subunit